MNIIYLILCVVILQVQASKKIKLCIPKKQRLTDIEQAELSFKSSYVKETNDEINIPGNFSMPLSIKDLISANVSASNITISGFHNYSLSLIPITFTLNGLKIKGDYYKLEGEISDLFDIYGNGSFDINLEKISVHVTDIRPSWPLFRCYTVKLDVKLEIMKATFQTIMGGDQLLESVMNKIIGDMGPDIVDYYWPLIYDILQPIIQEILDKTINKLDVENFSMLHLGNETILQNEHIRTSLKILSDVLSTQLGDL